MNIYLIMVVNDVGPDYVYTGSECGPIVVEAHSNADAVHAVRDGALTADRPKLYAVRCDVRRGV